MRVLRCAGLAWVLASAWIACRASPDPAALLAEADRLRSMFEKAASVEAVRKYRDASEAFERRGDRRAAAPAALAAGAARDQLGEPKDALPHYRQALALARSAGDPLLESEARSEAGIAHARLTELDCAAAECAAALALARQSGGAREEAKARICLGEVDYNQFRDHRGALAHYQAAEPVARRAGDRRGEAEALLYQGWVHSDLRELDRAAECYRRARALSIPSDDRRGGAMLTLAVARLQQRRGEYQDALDGYRRAVALLERSGDDFWLASTLTGIADVHLAMGDAAGSLEYLETRARVIREGRPRQPRHRGPHDDRGDLPRPGRRPDGAALPAAGRRPHGEAGQRPLEAEDTPLSRRGRPPAPPTRRRPARTSTSRWPSSESSETPVNLGWRRERARTWGIRTCCWAIAALLRAGSTRPWPRAGRR